ncbi:uncharacterized protein MYU51_007501 [Penicillium brevicompactum]|uniref:uncharacterized protein n=1 Tax=Penicillium brevicompactum TaxID=5074 RepID=UPI002540D469|nr:uncharacterized protein N7506_005982 [Penicillium brevicompactum]KAJ5332199.1 hypothetical protein N7506_005982 [Penicillium brevicompactum]
MTMYGLYIVLLALQGLGLVSAQGSNTTEKVWGVYAFTVYGDTKPNVLSSSSPLTDYGATELAAAASDFRSRYIAKSGISETGVQGISPIILDSNDVDVLSTTDQHVIGSAQAFMQGLYPPLGAMNVSSPQKVNGSFAQAPLDGYQYPRIVTLGEADPQSIMIEGQAKCNMYQTSESVYRNSGPAEQMARDTDAFYKEIWSLGMSGVWDESFATYTNAVPISEYLDYENLHNETFTQSVTDAQIIRARWLADQYLWNTNSQQSSSTGSMIRQISPIAGQTLASSIMQAFDLNIQQGGTRQKMTLMFGGDEPSMALSSLVGLANDHQPNFFSRLTRGGSFVFELYSFEENADLYPSYPQAENLYIRFLLHNGTANGTAFEPYSLFGHSPSQATISYSEFRSELETFAVSSIQEWCVQCNAESLFCTGALGQGNATPKKGMAPAVAGVIGAVVTLAVVSIAAIIGFFLCGACKGKSRKVNARSSLGGFKGPGKLASDTDVSFRNPIWGASKTSNADPSDGIRAGVVVPGHERLGSWEMGQAKKETEAIASDGVQKSPLGEEEDDWRIHSGLQPVKIRESV